MIDYNLIFKDYTSYTWSVPVDVSAYSLEKFVKLPGYTEDIKVMVENHCFATTVTINNVTQVRLLWFYCISHLSLKYTYLLIFVGRYICE